MTMCNDKMTYNGNLGTIQPQMKGEVLLYQQDSSISIEVLMESDTVWLSLGQMSMLFDRDKSVISRHIRNIYSEGELQKEVTVAKNATVQEENGRRVVRQHVLRGGSYLPHLPSLPYGRATFFFL